MEMRTGKRATQTYTRHHAEVTKELLLSTMPARVGPICDSSVFTSYSRFRQSYVSTDRYQSP